MWYWITSCPVVWTNEVIAENVEKLKSLSDGEFDVYYLKTEKREIYNGNTSNKIFKDYDLGLRQFMLNMYNPLPQAWQ